MHKLHHLNWWLQAARKFSRICFVVDLGKFAICIGFMMAALCPDGCTLIFADAPISADGLFFDGGAYGVTFFGNDELLTGVFESLNGSSFQFSMVVESGVVRSFYADAEIIKVGNGQIGLRVKKRSDIETRIMS